MTGLPSGCQLRLATQNDAWSIRRLVLGAFLDPTQLRWQQFWVVEQEGKLIACGQLRSFDEAQELGSIVVDKKWRNQGIGSLLTQHLIQQATKPLYLECLGHWRVDFYQRFGFERVTLDELPRSLQQKFGIAQTFTKILGIPLTLMKHPITQNNP